MNFDKFTQKSLEAVQGAYNIAIGLLAIYILKK